MNRAYRWALRAFPAEHRAVHEAEILEVLSEVATRGGLQPVRTCLDLAAAGVRVRTRRVRLDSAGVTGLLALLLAALMCVASVEGLVQLAFAAHYRQAPVAIGATAPLLIWPWVLSAGLAGMHRTAATAAWAAALAPALDPGRFDAQPTEFWMALSVLTAVILSLPPQGVRTGVRILGSRWTVVLLAGAGALAAARELLLTVGLPTLRGPFAAHPDGAILTCYGLGIGLLGAALLAFAARTGKVTATTLGAVVGLAVTLSMLHEFADYARAFDSHFATAATVATMGTWAVLGLAPALALGRRSAF